MSRVVIVITGTDRSLQECKKQLLLTRFNLDKYDSKISIDNFFYVQRPHDTLYSTKLILNPSIIFWLIFNNVYMTLLT